MKKILLLFAVASCTLIAFAQQKIQVMVDPSSVTEVSPYIFGHNLEHTRAAVNTGLSAQMLQNRKFAGKPSKNQGLAAHWFGIGERTFFTLAGDSNYTKHTCLEKMSRINELNNQAISNMTEGTVAGIGQYDLALTKGKEYSLRTVTRVSVPIVLKIELTDRYGDKVYASQQVKLAPAAGWHTEEFVMVPDRDDKDAAIRYTFTEKGELYFGALSMMPSDNFHGMRSDVVRDLKAIGPTIMRWPGGNFSGEYRWKDGLLPSDERGPLQAVTEIETQPYSEGYDYHEISTDDFIALCREIGAEPFLTINLAWNSPEESAKWVEYCNGGPDTEYGKIRIERGFKEPYNVKFWSLGNEMGFGHMEGPMAPADYAEMAGKHADAMLAVTADIKLFSSGPYPNDLWAQESAAKLAGKADYVSLHQYNCYSYYPNFNYTEGIKTTYEAIVSTPESNYEFAARQRKCLDATGKKFHISFDEWNVWYAWYRPSCVAEGIYTAKMLHMFIKESTALDIPFCCYFQPVGEGAIIIKPEESFLAANGQMFALMKEHKGGALCKIDGDPDRSVVATVKDGIVTITVINDSYDSAKEVSIAVKGKVAEALQYTSAEVVPYTRFEESALETSAKGGLITFSMQPHSVAMIKLKR